MGKKIRTVRGDIAPEELGYTSLHDHTFITLETAAEYMQSIFFDVREDKLAFIPENYDYLKNGCFLLSQELQVIDDEDGLAKEYGFFRQLGGQSVLDPTPSNVRVKGYPEKLVRLSEKTGLHFITAAGFYHDAAIPAELKEHDTQYYYARMKAEVENGIDGTQVRPGVLKGAFNTCSETERNIVEACIRLSAETGMSTHIHTEPTVDGDELLEILDGIAAKYSVDPDKIHICHMDNRLVASTMVTDFLEDMETQRVLDLTVQRELLKRGYTIGFDTWGMPISNVNMFMPDDFDRLKATIVLIDEGFGDQITLGNDFSSKIEWKKYGGYGCTRFAGFAAPLMEMMGREEQYHKLVYDNPARILAF